jgi:glycosyltransferase involved in cell wall biosynthesis
MKNKKILIISPTPSHPQNAGNRTRIFSFVELLKSKNFDVYFLYIKMEGEPHKEMLDYWGENLFVLNVKKNINSPKTFLFHEKVLHKIGFISHESYFYNYHIDDWFDDSIINFCSSLHEKYLFNNVVVQYIFLSKAFLAFPKNVLKIVETHDCLTDRYKVYPLENGKRYSKWFSTYKHEEKKGLNRADRIIAIQDEEEQYFKKLSSKKVVTIGHLFNNLIFKKTQTFQKILFFASSNPTNVDGYNFFVENIWQKLKAKLPDAELIVAGLICNKISKRDDITYLGEIDDKNQVYENARIAINPMRFGSGLKIKTLEALIQGVPVVSTSHGATGLKTMENKCIFVADDTDLFCEHIYNLFYNNELYSKTQKYITTCLTEYKERNMQNFLNIFEI